MFEETNMDSQGRGTRPIVKFLIPMLFFGLGVFCTVILIQRYQIVDLTVKFRPQLSFADGSIYAGETSVDGVLDGGGYLEWPTGASYEGHFKNGMFDGYGKLVSETGAIYEGQYIEGIAHGEMLISYADGSRYEGEVYNYLPEGKGVMEYPNGDKYSGEFKNGMYEGFGELVKTSGETYTGQFKEHYFNGNGKYVISEYGVYEGEFVSGEFVGKGVFISEDGGREEGEFKSWTLNGEGIKLDSKGNKYIGQFEDGNIIGKGSYEGVNGDMYEGEFDYDRFNGTGKIVYASGDIYEGMFKYGDKHGEGIYRYSKPLDDVKEVVGVWSYGKLKSVTEGMTLFSGSQVTEHGLYKQNEKLNAVLDGIAAGISSQQELFVLGVGSYGTEEVFNREVSYMEKLFSDVADSRAIYLSNSRRDIESRPYATTTSIGKSLIRIGERMNKDDILLMYVTSHGSKNEISVRHSGLDLEDLSAEALKNMLEQSNIKNRVIILSSCYSGSFVDTLKDENTLIMTSSRHDRKSFGCADNLKFTYFGEAIFQESLTTEKSFISAFEKAKNIIAEREDEEDKTPSIPQFWASNKVLSTLTSWEKNNLPLKRVGE